MAETSRMGLPLLDPAQAQKHVSVNEALARADALAAGLVEEVGRTDPPAAPREGTLWAIGAGATGEWAGRDGRLGLFLNGGWRFAEPWEGMEIADRASGRRWRRIGGTWLGDVLACSPGGAATRAEVFEIEHEITPGASSTTAPAVADKAVVLGVTGRVLDAIGGADAWSIGVPGAAGRYGTGYGITAGAFARGLTGQPQTYYAPTPLLLTAEGGDFTGGRVRLAIHTLSIAPPD